MIRGRGDADQLYPAEVRRLVGDLAALTERVESTKETADSAHRAIAALAEVVRKATGDRTRKASGDQDELDTGSWLVVDDPDRAAAMLADLVVWLGRVYVRWSDNALGECWLWHPATVAELLALRDGWNAAYGPNGSPAAVLDWHDRYRPGTARRVAAELAGCSLARHVATGSEAYRPARVLGTELADELAAWWVDSHGATAAPVPTPAMLAEARARRADQEQY